MVSQGLRGSVEPKRGVGGARSLRTMASLIKRHSRGFAFANRPSENLIGRLGNMQERLRLGTRSYYFWPSVKAFAPPRMEFRNT